MRIGFSLPINYITGKLACELSTLWAGVYESVDECLRIFKGLGVTSVEISKISKETSPSQLNHAVEIVGDMGLGITIHGWLPEIGLQPDVPLGIQELEKTLIRHEPQSRIPFTVHSRSYNHCIGATENEITKQTIQDLNLLLETLAPKSVLAAALELCQYKERRSVGVTFEDVLSIVEQVSAGNLGICWDMGHSQANYLAQKDVRLPSEEFVKQVIHTHIHGVGSNGRTHWPVLTDQGYVRDCVDILKSSGYAGIYNIELSLLRWELSPKECRSHIEASINSIARMLS